MKTIPIANIVINLRLRLLQPESVRSLAESIKEIDLINPITVASVPEYPAQTEPQFALIAGLHRLEAFKMLGRTEIPATVITATRAEQRLMEIDENLERAELTNMERAEHLAERKRLYEEIYPETKDGACGGGKNGVGTRSKTGFVKSTNPVPSFVNATAQKLNCSESTIQKAVRRATQITPEIKEIIRDIPAIANRTKELDALASMTPAEQAQAVEAVKTGKSTNIRSSTRSGKRAEPNVVMTTKPDPVEQLLSGKIDWEGKAKHAEDLVKIQEGHILTYKREIVKLKGKIKELESRISEPALPPASLMAEIEEWKRRALEAEEQCINLDHRINGMEQSISHGDRGAALRSMLDELETNLTADPGEFFTDTLNFFENRFMDLVVLIKNIKRR